MALSGAPNDAHARACPFVALESDRDRRLEDPDPRHRCYAEQVPAPRTIPHQEKFCLSPDFAACPVFQEWALRAAAQPAPQARPAPAHGDTPLAAAAAAAGPAEPPSTARATSDPEPEPELWFERLEKAHTVERQDWPDSMAAAAPATVAHDAGRAPESSDSGHLGAFEAPMEEPPGMTVPVMPAALSSELPSSFEGDERRADERPTLQEADAIPVPTFLQARSSRPRTTATTQEEIQREDVVPSLSVDRRRRGGDGARDSDADSTFSRLLTVAAVVIILALGVATVVIVPGLLAGSPPQTNRPSFPAVASSGSAFPQATSVAFVPSDTVAPPTPPVASSEPLPTPVQTPTPTPRSYKIQPGDSLRRIAREFGVTVEQIIAANPTLSDADHIEIGQRILIPVPQPS